MVPMEWNWEVRMEGLLCPSWDPAGWGWHLKTLEEWETHHTDVFLRGCDKWPQTQWRSEVNIRCLPQSLLHLKFCVKVSYWVWNCSSNRPLKSTYLFLPNPRITDAHWLARFYRGSGYLNSEHPIYAAGILPSESFLQSYDDALSQVRQGASWKGTSAQSEVPQPISQNQQKNEGKKTWPIVRRMTW